jgi:hypothetical protein
MKRLLGTTGRCCFGALVWAGILTGGTMLRGEAPAQETPEVLFREDFQSVQPGDIPDEFLVLDGLFEVVEQDGQRWLELPGAPLETFGVLFGPNESSGVEVRARIRGTREGRKFPTFMVGLNGVRGFKLRVAPSKNALELLRDEEVLERVPFRWTSGEWTSVRLQVLPGEKGVRLLAKAWQGADEPDAWMVTAGLDGTFPRGKAGVWGLPFSGTPIQFDDLAYVRVP